MGVRKRHFGLTLTELVVTVAIAAVLMGISVPAARRLADSLQGGAGTRGLISAALSNARAIAARSGKDAGIWFRQDSDGRTVMTYVVYDYEQTGWANGFRAVEGRKPIPLPEGVIVRGQIGEFWDTTFSIVFNPAGKLVMRQIRLSGDGFDRTSINSFRISDADAPAQFNTLMVSPYNGELIGD